MREARSLGPRWWRRLRSRRVLVVDGSMLPALEPGDRLLVDPHAYRDRLPAAGEIVVLADPEGKVRWLVKRVRRVDPGAGTVEVLGDAGERARDSRSFGPVPLRSLLGRAYRRYFPPDRQQDL